MKTPIVEMHDNVLVVCDHKLPGGSKTRYLPMLCEGASEVVYASSAQGGGQVAVAHVAKQLGIKATIFTNIRTNTHRRQYEAFSLGAKYQWVKGTFLNIAQAHAKRYALETGAKLLPFGLGQDDQSIELLADAARSLKLKPTYVWIAGGSGATAKAMRRAWVGAEHHIVQCGADIADPGNAEVHKYPKPYKWEAPSDTCPFPACRVYEVKAWQHLQQWRKANPRGLCLFWSVMSSPAI